jgi:hypothetical protein
VLSEKKGNNISEKQKIKVFHKVVRVDRREREWRERERCKVQGVRKYQASGNPE